MSPRIYALLIAAFLFIGAVCDDEPTRLTYVQEYEVEQEDDFIEVTLEIESESRSLVEALANAKRTAEDVTALANNYCKENAKKGKGDCKEAVDVLSNVCRSASLKSSHSTKWSAKRPPSQVLPCLPSLHSHTRCQHQGLPHGLDWISHRFIPQIP